MTSLLIIQSGFLGDAVLASGMLRGIASARPDVRVGLVVRAAFAGLFQGHPGVTTLHSFEKQGKDGTEKMVVELKREGYEVALLPHRSLRTALIARRAVIPRRIGFRQSDASWLLTERVEYRIAHHETERNAALLGAAGIATDATLPWLLPDAEVLDGIRRRFNTGRPIVVIAPGSVWPTKRWTPRALPTSP